MDHMDRMMSNKIESDLISRRKLLRSALTLGAAGLAAPALAQDALQDMISAPRRGTWDDQFDANAAARTAVNVISNNPVLGPNSPAYIQQAIAQYQGIVANGGWPMVQVCSNTACVSAPPVRPCSSCASV